MLAALLFSDFVDGLQESTGFLGQGEEAAYAYSGTRLLTHDTPKSASMPTTGAVVTVGARRQQVSCLHGLR
jgi:hypothetical protein